MEKHGREWLVNYETGKIISLEDGKYVELSFGEGLAVTDGLIFSIDPYIIDGIDQNELENLLGADVELINFNGTQDSGLTSESFNFDGVNDYIKVRYDNETEKQELAQNGFTFEYYGTLNQGQSYNESGNPINNTFSGIFCYWSGNEARQAKYRFGFYNNRTISWNAGFGNFISDFSEQYNPWNILYEVNIQNGEEVYYTITLDTSNSYEKNGQQYYKQTMYANGMKLYEGDYSKLTWDNFIENDLLELKYFCVGRSSKHNEGWWHYTKMNAYTLRLYNKALTQSEVKENYSKSIAYREMLNN